jgi:hypothetical protein
MRGDNTTTYNLKGFAIGNGITDWNVDAAPATFEAFVNFNLISPELYAQFAQYNCKYNVAKNITNDAHCAGLETQVDNLIAGLNPYDVYRTTYGNGPQAQKRSLQAGRSEFGEVEIGGEIKKYQRGVRLEQYTPWVKHNPLLRDAAAKISFGDPMGDYLNRAAVRGALNIPQSV